MRLSLRESRIRGRGWRCVVGNRGSAGARGTRTEPWDPKQLGGDCCGIPHLAKNERDVGHPAIVAGIEPRSAFATGKSPARETKGRVVTFRKDELDGRS
jgi:hypothetical protein